MDQRNRSISADADATGPHEVNPLAQTMADVDPNDDALLSPELMRICRDVIAPLVIADSGVMYLVKVIGDDVHIHLTGTCAGCPGASLCRDGVIAPAVRSVMNKARVVVTTGYRVPAGAKKIA